MQIRKGRNTKTKLRIIRNLVQVA